MRRVRLACLAAFVLAGFAAPPAAGQALRGSFEVDSGPPWFDSPPTYTCLEACALLFGGDASGYDCSTSAASIDNQAFVSGWGTDQYCITPVAEDFKVGDTVSDCGSVGCYYSAYVSDWCDAGVTNHCWLPNCGDGDLDPNEQCDDGNLTDGDCCSSTCQAEPAAQSCSDDDVCNGVEECDGAGSCQAVIPALDCADGDPCTQDSCDALTGCANAAGPDLSCDELAGKASLDLDATKGKASFAWQKGAVAFEALGTPTADTDYALCVYDGADAALLRLDVPAGGTCDAKPCWKATGKPGRESGFVYKDKAGASDGVRSLALKSHESKAKLALAAKGENVPAPALGSGALLPVRAQLVHSEGACWGASFGELDVQQNDGERLKAARKAGAP